MAGMLTHERRRDFIWIIAGSGLTALATNLFFTPAHLVPGGFTGLAIIIKHLTAGLLPGGVPTWFSNAALNVPLILLSIRSRGWRFLRRTFAASIAFSVWLFLIPEYPLAGSDLFLNAAVGGALMGIGLGFVFLGKATTGGTDTLAALIQRHIPHRSVASVMQVLDAVIILLSVWIFGMTISLYAVIAVVLTSYIADDLIGGFRNAYVAYIISEKSGTIASEIMEELDRGVTELPGVGLYTGQSRPVLFCAVSKKQTVILRDLVADIDPKAFLILTDAKEIRGEGFLGYSREELT